MKKSLFLRGMAFLLCLCLLLGSVGTLSVKAEETEKKIKVVLVLDTATDNEFYYNGSVVYRASSAIFEVRQAAQSFAEALFRSKKDVEIAVVSYSNNAVKRLDFSGSETIVDQTIEKLSVTSGGRNIAAALATADSLLSGVEDEDCEKTIVLLSTGMASSGEYSENGHWSYSSEGGSWYDMQTGINLYAYSNMAYNKAAEIKNKGTIIYSIGLFYRMQGAPSTVMAAAKLFENTAREISSGDDFFFKVYDTNKIKFAFKNVSDNILLSNTVKSDYFNYASGKNRDYSAKFYFDTDYFGQSAAVYNPSLATMSLCFAVSSFGTNYSNKNQYVNAESLLKDNDFRYIEANSDFKSEPGLDTMGVIIGMRDVKTEDEEYTLIALSVRGGNYFSEWGGNFKLGPDGNHAGFTAAKTIALNFLNDYVTRHKSSIKGKVKLWMAGYSRGGATVNLLAGDLSTRNKIGSQNEVDIARNNIFAYCFEPPRGLNSSVVSAEKARQFTNIHNIVNPNDFVPMVAMKEWGFIRYGTDEKVIPSSLLSATYNNAAAQMMRYYVALDTECVKDTTISLSDYESKFSDVIQRVHDWCEKNYNSTQQVYFGFSNFKREHGYLPKFDTVWSQVKKDYLDGKHESYVFIDFDNEYTTVLRFTEISLDGNYGNAYDFLNTYQQLNKFAYDITPYEASGGNTGARKITDNVSRVDLFRYCRFENGAMLSLMGFFDLINQNYTIDNSVRADNALGDLLSLLTAELGSRGQYNQELEKGISTILKLLMMKNSTLKASTKLNVVTDNFEAFCVLLLDFLFSQDLDEDVDVLYEGLKEVYKKNGLDFDQYLLEGEHEDFKKGLVGLLNAVRNIAKEKNGSDTLFSVGKNIDVVGAAHYPELCLAWLQSQDPNYNAGASRIYSPSRYRIIRINCPVDVEAFDSNGICVAKIIDNVPQIVKGSSILSGFSENGEKIIYLPIDETYEVKISATGEGMLNLAVNEIEDDSYVKIINYYDIVINQGDVVQFSLPKEFFAEEDGTVCVKDIPCNVNAMGKEIEPSVYLTGEESAKEVYKIEVKNGNEKGGYCEKGDVYSLGSYAVVKAQEFEDCTFVGWFENDELVSSEREYRFRVNAERLLEARFDGQSAYGQNGNFYITVSSGENGSIFGNDRFKAPDGYPVEICALADDGYLFDHWESSDECIITDSTKAITTVKAISENVNIRAIFVKSSDEELPEKSNDELHEITGCTVVYHLDNSWPGGYNGTVTISNNSGEDVSEWMLGFDFSDEIIDVWNAEVLSAENGKYLVNNSGWNSRIENGKSVTFGFTAKGTGEHSPESFKVFIPQKNALDSKYTCEFVPISTWSEGYAGELVITNTSENPISDWSASFVISGKLESVWNALLVSNENGKVTVKNTESNAVIRPGESVRIGVNVSKYGESEFPSELMLIAR